MWKIYNILPICIKSLFQENVQNIQREQRYTADC